MIRHVESRGAPTALSLREAFDPRRNSFDVLRLLFAVIVGIAHGSTIQTEGWQPHWGESTFGDFALDGFFVLSGFLVVRSFLNLSSLSRYVWHRVLRIMPGFYVCLVVTALVFAPVAAVLRGRDAGAVFTDEPSAWSYLVNNAALFMIQYDIGGIFADQRNDSFNGSLWTLSFEAFCYGVIALLGVLGLLHRRGAVLLLMIVLAAFTVAEEVGDLGWFDGVITGGILRLLFAFVLGAVACLYAEYIPMRGDLAVAAVAVFLASPVLFEDYRVLGAAPLAYVYLWFATRFPWPMRIRTDLSYGMYIYHFPIFQLMGVTALVGLPTPVFLVIGLTLAIGPAALSWSLVERPAMALKDSPFPDRVARALRRSRGRHAAAPGRPSFDLTRV